MKKFTLPALGAALALGALPVAADEIQLSQLMIIGQPGQTGNVNRTLPSGSAGISQFNTPAPGPFAFPTVPGTAQPSPFIGQRGDLNFAEPEAAGPAERDASGRLQPSVDRTQARFTGERGPDGKLLPSYVPPQEAQARPGQPAAPAPTELKRDTPPSSQPSTTQGRQPSGQAQTGTSGTGMTDKSMQKSTKTQRSGSTMSSRGHAEEYTTTALNKLSAEGYTNFGRLERVGNTYQTTAMRQGRQVNVSVDLDSGRITER
jgi:hypothetical protein